MEGVSTGLLLVLFVIAFRNFTEGTLGAWVRAKFLNDTPNTKAPEGGGPGLVGLLARAKADEAKAKAKNSSKDDGGGGVPVNGWSDPLPAATQMSTPYGRGHDGVDLTLPGAAGKTIRAARAGEVISAGIQGGYGIALDIDHGGGITTKYGHCSELLVGINDKVRAGQAIAKVGSTGESTGPHLHFEVRRGGSPVDPCGIVPIPLCKGAA